MKRFLINLAFFLLMTFSARSQSSRWNFGLEIGLGLTGAWTDRDPHYLIPGGQTVERLSPRLGTLVGTRISYLIHKRWTLETGLGYQTMKDHLYREGRDPYNLPYKNEATYTARRFQLPVQVRYSLTSSLKSIYLKAGVLFTTLHYLNADFAEGGNYTIDLHAKLNRQYRHQIPLLVGFGIPVGKRWSVELSYQYNHRSLVFQRWVTGDLTIALQPEESHLNKGLFLSTTYELKKR